MNTIDPNTQAFSHDLRPGDVLANGGTVTTAHLDRHTGRVVVELDYCWPMSWPAYTIVEVMPRG